MAGDGAAAGQPRPLAQRVLVPAVFALFVLLRALDRAFLNRVLKIMGPYGGTLMNLYWPICIQCIVVCIVGGVVARRRHAGDEGYSWRWFAPWNPVASSAGAVPWHWMAVFSFWDQLNASVQSVAQQYIPAPLQTPINNTATLWTAVVAYFYLGSRFRGVHVAGCVLILLACVTGVTVELQQGTLPKPVDANGGVVSVPTLTLVLFYAVYLIGVVPQGVGNCYKQKKLKSVDLDIMWATLWSGNWQVLWGFLFYTINWIPYPVPGGHNTQSPATLGRDLSDAWTCFTGSNPGPDVTTCSSEPAWAWFVVYLAFNMFFNLLLLWLTKYLSATWASIGNVLCGNLYAVFNQWRVVGGDSARAMRLEDWLALAYSSVAMWVYNMEDERGVDGESVYGVAQAPPGPGGDEERGALLADGASDDDLGPVNLLVAEGPSPPESRHHSEM